MDLRRIDNNGNNGVVVSVENGNGTTRKRRKSKYLSSPYTNKKINLRQEHKKKKMDMAYFKKTSLEMLSDLHEAAVIECSGLCNGYFLGFRKWVLCENNDLDDVISSYKKKPAMEVGSLKKKKKKKKKKKREMRKEEEEVAIEVEDSALPDLNTSPGLTGLVSGSVMDFTLQMFVTRDGDQKLEISGEPPEKMKMKKGSLESFDQKKPKKKKLNDILQDMNLTYRKLHEEEDESIGSVLLLKFNQEQEQQQQPPSPPLPSKVALLKAFSGFGILNESESDVFHESHTAQIVFLNGYEAGNAFRSLEKTNPFGKSLLTFRLIHLSEPPVKSSSELENTRRITPLPSSTFPIASVGAVNGLVLQSRPVSVQKQQPANLTRMKDNLEMMTRMLEKTGNNLSPELRMKLENDINGLLTRIRIMGQTA